jgi:hypothetical protein
LQLTQGNAHRLAHFRITIVLGGQQRLNGAFFIQLAEGQGGFLAQVADAVAEGFIKRYFYYADQANTHSSFVQPVVFSTEEYFI